MAGGARPGYRGGRRACALQRGGGDPVAPEIHRPAQGRADVGGYFSGRYEATRELASLSLLIPAPGSALRAVRVAGTNGKKTDSTSMKQTSERAAAQANSADWGRTYPCRSA